MVITSLLPSTRPLACNGAYMLLNTPTANLLPSAADAALSVVLVFATAVWLGGFVTLVIVARTTRRTLEPAQRVALFRGLGRAFGGTAGGALCIGLACGIALLLGTSWSDLITTAVVLAGCLVVTTLGGVVQARRMTRLRRAALGDPDNPGVHADVQRGARRATGVRALIGVLSVALVVVGVLIAG